MYLHTIDWLEPAGKGVYGGLPFGRHGRTGGRWHPLIHPPLLPSSPSSFLLPPSSCPSSLPASFSSVHVSVYICINGRSCSPPSFTLSSSSRDLCMRRMATGRTMKSRHIKRSLPLLPPPLSPHSSTPFPSKVCFYSFLVDGECQERVSGRRLRFSHPPSLPLSPSRGNRGREMTHRGSVALIDAISFFIPPSLLPSASALRLG